jgi:ubiquinone/menaquinone biosynthesis C-methylase UbiE
MKIKVKRNHDLLYLKENRYENPKKQHKDLVKVILKLLPEIKKIDMPIRDIGCAAGELIYYLNKKTKSSITLAGYDIVNKLINKAKKKMKNNNNVSFHKGSIEDKSLIRPSSSSLCIFSGVLSIFDEFQSSLNNLIRWTTNNGYIIVLSIFNDYPYDVLIKYRSSNNFRKNEYHLGWNTFSKKSIKNFLKNNKNVKDFYFKDLYLDFNLKKNEKDLMRTWTIEKKTKKKKFLTNGLNVIFKSSILLINVKK